MPPAAMPLATAPLPAARALPQRSTDPASSGNPDIGALLGQANAGVISISELMQQVGGRYTVLVDPLGTIRLGPPQESTAGAFSTAADSSDDASTNVIINGAAAGSTGTAATSTDPASSGNPDIGALLGQANAGVISISELMQQVGGRYTVLVDPLGTISLGPPQESTAGAFSTAADSSDDASTNVIINGAAAGSTGTAATSTDPASSGNPDIGALLGQANAGVSASVSSCSKSGAATPSWSIRSARSASVPRRRAPPAHSPRPLTAATTRARMSSSTAPLPAARAPPQRAMRARLHGPGRLARRRLLVGQVNWPAALELQ